MTIRELLSYANIYYLAEDKITLNKPDHDKSTRYIIYRIAYVSEEITFFGVDYVSGELKTFKCNPRIEMLAYYNSFYVTDIFTGKQYRLGITTKFRMQTMQEVAKLKMEQP